MISVHFPTSLWLNVSSWFGSRVVLAFHPTWHPGGQRSWISQTEVYRHLARVRWRFVVPQNTVEVDNYLVWRYVSLPETNSQFIAENGWKLEDDPAKATASDFFLPKIGLFSPDRCLLRFGCFFGTVDVSEILPTSWGFLYFFPLFCRVLAPSQVVVWDFWTINSITYRCFRK